MTRFRKLPKLRHPRVYVLSAILSDVFNAFAIALDDFILHPVVISSIDHVVRPLAYILSARWIGVLLTSAYTRFLGQLIDSKLPSSLSMQSRHKSGLSSLGQSSAWSPQVTFQQKMLKCLIPLARVCCDRRSLNFPVEAVPKLAKLRT